VHATARALWARNTIEYPGFLKPFSCLPLSKMILARLENGSLSKWLGEKRFTTLRFVLGWPSVSLNGYLKLKSTMSVAIFKSRDWVGGLHYFQHLTLDSNYALGRFGSRGWGARTAAFDGAAEWFSHGDFARRAPLG